MSDKEAVEALAGAVGTIDILINNAGIWRFGPLLSMSVEDTQAVLGVNLLGPLYCSQAFVPGMAEAGGGAIVNLSSAAAATRSPGIGIYPVTKGAIETLTKQMSLEWGPLGIRVNAVGPGLIVTEGTAHNYEGEARARRAQSVPLRRIGDPLDIAAAVAFLASPAASYISGQVLYVDGAVTAGQLARRGRARPRLPGCVGPAGGGGPRRRLAGRARVARGRGCAGTVGRAARKAGRRTGAEAGGWRRGEW